jgi:hypothetical protein
MAFWDFLVGKQHQAKTTQLPTMSPEQMNILNSMLSQMQGPMSQGFGNLSQILSGSPEAFKAFEAPAMRQFNEQIVPGIAERFSGIGSGAQGSSAFGQTLGQAGAGLSENLAAMRANLQQNAMGQLSNMLGMGLGARPFENVYQPAHRDYGLLGSMMPGIGAGIGGAIGGLPSTFMLSSMLKQFAPKAAGPTG